MIAVCLGLLLYGLALVVYGAVMLLLGRLVRARAVHPRAIGFHRRDVT